jgi:hypothetical protein
VIFVQFSSVGKIGHSALIQTIITLDWGLPLAISRQVTVAIDTPNNLARADF